jgi:hypothetical protein
MVEILETCRLCAGIVAIVLLFSLAIHLPLEPFYPQDEP